MNIVANLMKPPTRSNAGSKSDYDENLFAASKLKNETLKLLRMFPKLKKYFHLLIEKHLVTLPILKCVLL